MVWAGIDEEHAHARFLRDLVGAPFLLCAVCTLSVVTALDRLQSAFLHSHRHCFLPKDLVESQAWSPHITLFKANGRRNRRNSQRTRDRRRGRSGEQVSPESDTDHFVRVLDEFLGKVARTLRTFLLPVQLTQCARDGVWYGFGREYRLPPDEGLR